MPRTSRRSFFRWLGGALAAIGIPRRRGLGASPSRPPAPPSFSADDLRAIAEVVLPGALGAGGIAVAAASFGRWIDGYRPGAELVHGYGTGDIRFAGPSPAPRWRQQLADLDAAAHRAHGSAFRTLSLPQRDALIRAALPADLPARIPSPLGAPHIAIALLAHFVQSSAATDLCYERQIGKSTCRPLGHASREPLPLALAPSSGRPR